MTTTVWFLALVCPQAWIVTFLEGLRGNPYPVYETFYFAEGITLAVVALVFYLRGRSRKSDAQDGALSAGFGTAGTDGALSTGPGTIGADSYGGDSTSVPDTTSAPRLFLPLPVIVVMSSAMALALIGSPGSGLEWLSIIAAVLGGFSQIACYLQCFDVYRRIGVEKRIGYILVSFALAPILRFPLSLLPLVVAGVVVSLLPLACFLMCLQSLKHISHDDMPPQRPATSSGNSNLISYVVILVLFGVAMGQVRLQMPALHSDILAMVIALVLKVGFPLLLLAVLRRFRDTNTMSLICQLALVIVIIAVAIVSQFSTGGNAIISATASDLARYMLTVTLYATLAILIDHAGIHAFTLFGIGWAPYAFSQDIGMLIANAHGGAEAATGSLAIDIICVLVIGVMVILNFRRDADRRLFADAGANSGTAGIVSTPEARFDEIGRKYNLTNRESQIMRYICEGYSKHRIAEQLVITENTVRGYAKTLYTKLDVHSRDELLDLVNHK